MPLVILIILLPFVMVAGCVDFVMDKYCVAHAANMEIVKECKR